MIRILVADDHQLIRDAWSLVLDRDKRFKVIATCSDANEAVRMSRKFRPDIILLDINMPPFNGIEATKLIRKNSPNTRIIAVTMNNQPAYVKKMMQLGAKAYVTKNSSVEEMKEAILKVMAGNIFICSEMTDLMSEEADTAKNYSAIQLLTERETEIVNLVTKGLSSKEISQELEISIKTVEAHRYNAYKKLRLNNSTSLIQFINESVIHG